MKSINTGAPHFRSIAKQHRHANYTLDKVINEAVDNIVKKATEIHITTIIDDMGRLQELKISDNYIDGFENIDREGTACPLNMGHVRDGHDCDDETSEFGVGLKAGALNAGNKLEVITRISKTNKYIKVVCDFQRMMNEPDVNNSYNPVMREASVEEYTEYHPFCAGSSIIVSQIRENICKATTAELITKDILDGISNTYSRLLCDARKIVVNGIVAEKEHDFFADPKCALFTIKKEIVMLHKGNDVKIMARKIGKTTTWQEFNVAENKWCALQGGADTFGNYLRDGYKHMYDDADGSCIKVETTYTRFSDFPDILKYASDFVHIYKDRRKYGKKSFVKHNDGYDNYTIHKIDFKAKQIGKILGITYNKEITMDGNNDFINALKSAVGDHRKEFRTSTELKYCALFEKALECGIMHWKTCKHDLLPEKYKILRDDYDLSLRIAVPVVSASNSDDETNSENDDDVTDESSENSNNDDAVAPVENNNGAADAPLENSNNDAVAPVENSNNDNHAVASVENSNNGDTDAPVENNNDDAVAPIENNNDDAVAPIENSNNGDTDAPVEKNSNDDDTDIDEPVANNNDDDTDIDAPVANNNDDDHTDAPPENNNDGDTVAPLENNSNDDAVAPVENNHAVEEPTTPETFVKQFCQNLMLELAQGSIATKSLEEVKAWMIASITK